MIELISNLLNQLQKEAVTPPLYDIYSYCKKAIIEINRPMRIAITGKIKTGKSTLLNSFLGRYIAPTAEVVLTYIVSWFHHVNFSEDGKEKIKVHFHDGNVEIFPLSTFNSLVAYKAENKEYADTIHWIDVFVDHPILKIFDIIDTPGLDSLLGTESQHTRDLLTNDDNRPDAIIYLMIRGFAQEDMDKVQAFHQATGLMNGLNAIAALTRVDELPEKYIGAEEIIQRNIDEHAVVRYYFSEIFPIAALPAQAFYTLSDNNIELLKLLSGYTGIDNFTCDQNTFENDLDFLSLPERKSLLFQLSIEGIRMAIDYFRQHLDAKASDFKNYLYQFSKVEDLQKFIVSHFGERADFYKSMRVIAGLKKVSEETNRKCTGKEKEIVESFIKRINTMNYTMQNYYASYYILKDYYDQADYFNDDEWEKAKRILGEFGQTDKERLNISTSASEEEIQLAYKKSCSYWSNLAYLKSQTGKTKGCNAAVQIKEIIEITLIKE